MVQQADLIGVGSLPIVLSACFFTGVVLALNSAKTLQRFGSVTLIGQLVSIGMVRELGPLLAGLMVAGRNASGMASELGSMVVTEQIDAMRALGTDPMKKLVTPRVISDRVHAVLSDDSWRPVGPGRRKLWCPASSRSGLAPVLEYGLAVSGVSGCVHGVGQASDLRLHHRHRRLLLRAIDRAGGTQGVGRATTQAVVAAIDSDYRQRMFFVTRLLMVLLGATTSGER